MKKLFLYVLLFVGIFSLCFLLANEYFKQRMQEKEGQKMERQWIFGRDSEWTCDSVRGRYATGV